MSPEFQRFQLYLKTIAKKEENPIEIIFREDLRESLHKDHAIYVLYCYYGDDN